MIRRWSAPLVAVALLAAAPAPSIKLEPVPHNAQTAVVTAYLRALQSGAYAAAYALLNPQARAYYRSAANFRSVFEADRFRVQKFALVGTRGDDRFGRVFFARETARFRDHAHDTDDTIHVTATVGVVPTTTGWRIKDPGHPWNAFEAHARSEVNGLRVTVKKVSFFERRIEVVVTFANVGTVPITVLPYGKSVLRDASGTIYRIIETKDWSLTDKVLFEGALLAPNAEYTGALTFESQPLERAPQSFSLTVGPALQSGADAPFLLDVRAIEPLQPTAGA